MQPNIPALQGQKHKIMESDYLKSLERETPPSLSDMNRQDYEAQIYELKASNEDFKASSRRLLEMIETLKQTLDSVTASNKRNEALVVRLTAQVDELQQLVRNLEDRKTNIV